MTAARMTCVFEELDVYLCVTTPIGSMYRYDLKAQNCTIVIHGKLFLGDLILLGIHGYDVILGMDWLTKYHATIDCKQKTLALITFEGESIMYKGSCLIPTVPLISAVKACKLVRKGCTAHFCKIEIVDTQELDLQSIPVV